MKQLDDFHALQILFDKLKAVCLDAGLEVRIIAMQEDPDSGYTAWMDIERGLAIIYSGEITIRDEDKLIKWARIETATSIEELPEGLADHDVRIREKAEAKKKQLEVPDGRVTPQEYLKQLEEEVTK